MKPNILVVTFFSAVAFTVGCKEEESTSQQIEKVQTESKQAVADMNEYTYARKSEFVEKMQAQLAELNQDIDKLAAKVEKASDQAKAEAQPKLKALREQGAKLELQLVEVKNATESTWDGVKASSRKAYGDFKDGINQARQWISDKIAP